MLEPFSRSAYKRVAGVGFAVIVLGGVIVVFSPVIGTYAVEAGLANADAFVFLELVNRLFSAVLPPLGSALLAVGIVGWKLFPGFAKQDTKSTVNTETRQ